MKTNKQAAEEYADNFCQTRDELFWMRKSDFLAGAKFKESQLMPLIEHMTVVLECICSVKRSDLNENTEYWGSKIVGTADSCIKSVKEQLKIIKGDENEN